MNCGLPLGLAVALGGALLLAAGSELQSRAVFAAQGRWRTFLAAPRWYGGLSLLATAVATNFIALALAPVSVVQSVSVIALAVSAVVSAVNGRASIDWRAVAAILLCITGIVGFILVMHASLSEAAPQPPLANLRSVTLALAGASTLAASGVLVGTRGRSHTLVALGGLLAAAITFGSITTVFKVLVTLVLGSGVSALAAPLPLLALGTVGLGALAANVLLQRSHARFPTPVVVAALTIVDPLTAATIGITVLGEVTLTAATLSGLLVFGAIAGLGVVGVTRIHRAPPAAPVSATASPDTSPAPEEHHAHRIL